MSPRKVMSTEEYYLRAAWDMLGDVCLTHAVYVAYGFLPSDQRGVFTLKLRAVRPKPNGSSERVVQYEMPFPSSSVGSLAAALFRCANQLDKLLTDAERFPAGKPAAD